MIQPENLFLRLRESRRGNFLSVGVTLCTIVAAICAAPLAFVHTWIAIWLLTLMTILVLGTFSIFAYYAIKKPKYLGTEAHAEQMAAISIFGQNRDGKPALLQSLADQPMVTNPEMSGDEPSL